MVRRGRATGHASEVIDKINTEITAGLADPRMKARLADFGDVPMPMTPTDFGNLIANETEKVGQGDTGGQHRAE